MGKSDSASIAEQEKLVERLVKVLQSQKQLGDESYPVALGRLAELAEVKVKDIANISNKGVFKNAILAARIIDKADRKTPLALTDDVECLATSPKTLEFILSFIRTATIHAFSVAQLKRKLTTTKNLSKRFQAHYNNLINSDEQLSDSVAWIQCNGPKLFLLADLHPKAADSHTGGHCKPSISSTTSTRQTSKPTPETTTPPDFAKRFAEAFDSLDKSGNNLVSLVDLRRELSSFDRGAFDAGLRELRKTGRYTLNSAEGRGGISEEERLAGILESGNLLLFVSRR